MNPRDFPRAFVRARASVELESGSSQLHTDWLDLRRTGIRVVADEPWSAGSKVSFKFTVLDDAEPVVGVGRVVHEAESWDHAEGDPSTTMCWSSSCPWPAGYMTIEFDSVDVERGGRVGRLGRGLSLASKLAADACRYAVGELAGNAVRRELDHRLPGYRTPVLLLHGLFGTRGALSLLEERLKRDAFPVFSFKLGLVNVRQIPKTAREVAQKVEGICQRQGIDRINVVGHSMGGLIGLQYIKKDGGHNRVRSFVAVGAPFSGSNWAYPGLALFGPLIPSMVEILPSSRFLRELRESPMPPGPKVTCIAAKDDLLVPIDSAVLPGARNVLVPRGHAGLVTSQIIYPIVRDALS